MYSLVGVVTKIELKELRLLFPLYNFTAITPISAGVMDTTYSVSNQEGSYILKHYERDISHKILAHHQLLSSLSDAGLNVGVALESKDGWYLYQKLRGEIPKSVGYYHIQALARFLAKMHQQTQKMRSFTSFLQNYSLTEILTSLKREEYRYYKELAFLAKSQQSCDGFIHGDIFKDNTLFEGEQIGVFDFIDGGCGAFVFDAAVALMAFNPQNKTSLHQLFCRSYNQSAPKKLNEEELQRALKEARGLYALLRIEKYKNTRKAKELFLI